MDKASLEFAIALDKKHGSFRQDFYIPTVRQVAPSSSDDSECVYLCGNSLGLQPKRTQELITQELDVWAKG
jgi:kynureninase